MAVALFLDSLRTFDYHSPLNWGDGASGLAEHVRMSKGEGIMGIADAIAALAAALDHVGGQAAAVLQQIIDVMSGL